MQIDELHVKNFRCFSERSFSLHPQFNVLIGGNGAGKTVVLRALRVALASWFLGIKGQSTVHIRGGDVRLAGRAFEAGEYTFEEQYPVEVSAEGMVRGGAPGQSSEPVSWKRTLGSSSGRTTRKGARALEEHARAFDARVREGAEVTLPALAYYSTSRLYLEPRRTKKRRRTPDRRDLSRLAGYRDSIDKRLDTKALAQWMRRQSQMAWKEGKDSTLYRLVREAVASMIESAEDVDYSPEREEVIIAFQSGEVVPLDYLSDGQRTTLTLVGDLAMRMARLNPHLGEKALAKTPGIVLIDEIDMHLHPAWQRHVVEDLKRTFPSVQFVTTTHSPFIIQTLDEGELRGLEEEGPHLLWGTVGIEAIAEAAMGVENPSRGPEYERLVKAVASYLRDAPATEFDDERFPFRFWMTFRSLLNASGIEEIAEEVMGVEHPDRGPKYHRMVEAAKDYLRTLEEASASPEDELQRYKRSLAEKIEPYADNPAFQAILELERERELEE